MFCNRWTIVAALSCVLVGPARAIDCNGVPNYDVDSASECFDCKGEATCIGFQLVINCVDLETAKHMGHGSLTIAKKIVDACLEKCKDSSKDDADLARITAWENFDCRTAHPADPQHSEIICNAPIDKAWNEDVWDDITRGLLNRGAMLDRSRCDFDKDNLEQAYKDDSRRMRLLKLSPAE